MKKIDLNTKNIILIGVSALMLLIALSVTYYFVIALPAQADAQFQLEKQKFDAEQKEKEDKRKAEEAEKAEEEAAKLAKESEYTECITEAENAFSWGWRSKCPIWKDEVDKAWKDCRSQVFSFETDQENKNRCIRSTPDYKEDEYGVCLLPTSRIDDLEESRDKKKDECFKLYKTN